jgi:hypothetical protein
MTLERLVFYCRTTSASTAPCTPDLHEVLLLQAVALLIALPAVLLAAVETAAMLALRA